MLSNERIDPAPRPHRARDPGQRQRKRRHQVPRVFRGPDPEPEHPRSLRTGLRSILAWSEQHCQFAGYLARKFARYLAYVPST